MPPWSRQTTLDRFTHDDAFRKQQKALLKTKVRKFFPGHGTFHGTITKSDTYHILFDDDDEEVYSFANIQKYIPGTPPGHATASWVYLLARSLVTPPPPPPLDPHL